MRWTSQPFADDLADRHARAERAERILEDDLHLPAQRPDLALAERLQVLPSNWMPPSLRSSRSRARPSVVLPEPDSPTRPIVWPSRSAMLTPSTAFT